MGRSTSMQVWVVLPEYYNNSPCGVSKKCTFRMLWICLKQDFSLHQNNYIFRNSKEVFNIISLFYLFFNEIIYKVRLDYLLLNQSRFSLILIISFEYSWDNLYIYFQRWCYLLAQLSSLFKTAQTTHGPSQNMDYTPKRCRATTCHECTVLT